MTIEQKAHEAHNANRALKEKYHIPYKAWIDWFTLGYRRAEKDYKEKAIESYKKACTCIGCNHCDDCDSVREFIDFLNS